MSGSRTRFQPRPETPMKLIATHLPVNFIPISHITGIDAANFFVRNTFMFQYDLFVCTLRHTGYIAESGSKSFLVFVGRTAANCHK